MMFASSQKMSKCPTLGLTQSASTPLKKKKEGHQIELNVEQPIDCKLINSKVGKFSIPNQTNDGSNYFGSSHTAKEHLQKTIDLSCFTKSSKRKFSPIPNLFPSFSTEHFKN
jgi:hypothetical protein